jgi:uncharacterized membrane-anchored protein
MFRPLIAGLLAACLCALSLPAGADMTAAAKTELEAAQQAAISALQKGPRDIKLLDQAALKLPADYGYVPNPQATRLMRALGNSMDDSFLGLVVHRDQRHAWLMTVEYQKSGYIKDDDAKHWKVDELLQNLKDGTEEANKDRAAKGIPELEVLGWIQSPQYTETSHQLIWSIKGHDKGAPQDSGYNINYNTYVLGREGYISMDLLTDPTDIQEDAVSARGLLGDLSFNSGKRYQDFNSSTDKVAEYGLAALIGGVALKKLGLFALAAAFFIKIWKIAALAIFGAVTGFKKYLKKKAALIPPPSPPGGNIK